MSKQLTDQQLLHYSRHILLNHIDLAGQIKFLEATILIVGCGGLGSVVIPYLAAAGIGTLIIADDDTIEISNLQRQTYYRFQDIGANKAHTMASVVHQLNPEVSIFPVTERLTLESLMPLIKKCDLVIDCSDNFETRKAINQASVMTLTPLISGAATQYEGQLSIFDPRETHAPCYACLFDQNKDQKTTDHTCATLGIFSPLLGIIGGQQAGEALKMIAHIGKTQTGILFQYDAFGLEHHHFKISKNPACKICRL